MTRSDFKTDIAPCRCDDASCTPTSTWTILLLMAVAAAAMLELATLGLMF